jgi:dTMP kinase
VSGLFITFEGGDGTGKSTQVRLLAEWLTEQGRAVVTTREPGGTEVGTALRDIVLHHRGEVDPRAEALLYAADRAQHIGTLVRPALERGDVVVQDRYIDSSVAYQGAGRVLDAAEIKRISMWATGDLVPDLTVLLDLPGYVARARLAGEKKAFDRLENEHDDFHERVRAGFLQLADDQPQRFLVVDATGSIDDIARVIRDRVGALL